MRGAWEPIETAPRDGTFIDMWRDGIRFTDCHYDTKLNSFVREHGYPSMTTILNPQPTRWMERPDSLLDPYTGGTTGKHRDD